MTRARDERYLDPPRYITSVAVFRPQPRAALSASYPIFVTQLRLPVTTRSIGRFNFLKGNKLLTHLQSLRDPQFNRPPHPQQ